MKRQASLFTLLTLSASLIISGCSRNGPPADVQFDQAMSPYHIVTRGESLSSIASKYHMDKSEIARLNGLKPPYRIVIGQRLLIGNNAMTYATSVPGMEISDGSDAPAVDPSTPSAVQVAQLQPLPGTVASAAPLGVEPVPGQLSTQTSLSTQENADEDEEDTKEAPSEKKKGLSAPPSSGHFTWPVKGKVLKEFAKGSGKTQSDGLNISAPKGTPVVAVNNGVVAHAGNQLRGFGNVVLIKHDNGLMSVYAHLDEVLVKRGDTVTQGQKIATVGKSGTVKEPQLHFEIRQGTTPVDPKKYLQ
jgi:murein DD-endopeptidase MepM/ murein hydrolase activator NlpD